MTRTEARRRDAQELALLAMGYTRAEAESLRRASVTLRRWHERECGTDGGCIERDDTTNKPHWNSSWTGSLTQIRDLETGALRRIARIVGRGPHTAYIQTDPRGCALYLMRPGDVPEGGDADSYYTRGLAIY